MVPGIRPQNLNDTFLAAARQARQKLPELAHNQKVSTVCWCEREPPCAFPYRKLSGRIHDEALPAIAREVQGHVVMIPFCQLTYTVYSCVPPVGCFFSFSKNRKVAHLYRHSLRCLLSWTIDRDIFNEAATELRSRFDANRGASLAASARLLQVRKHTRHQRMILALRNVYEIVYTVLHVLRALGLVSI
jgi:hypothetical protein